MFELIARGTRSDQRWRRRLPDEIPIEIGRAAGMWSVPWDSKVSRRHFLATMKGTRLSIRKLESASNPVFFQGSENDQFTLNPGEHFVVGDTTFGLSNDSAFVTQDVPDPVRQRTFTHEYLAGVSYRDADRRIMVLNRLPGVISGGGDERDLLMRLVNLLIAGIKSALVVGVIKADTGSEIEILHWDRRKNEAGDFQPSESLIRQAIDSGSPILHVWNQDPASRDSATGRSGAGLDETTIAGPSPDRNITVDYDNDWAFVCPLPGETRMNTGVYVAGKNRIDSGSDPYDLQGDIKFAELVTLTLGNVLNLRNMERRQSSLRPFFAPVVMTAFAGRDPEEVLSPRECDVSVLFCDLRGFAATSEEMKDDLIGLLSRVSETLGIMTRNVMDHGGVIGDFHGDAAMGFWGWPIEDTASVLRCCNAALAIQKEMQQHASDRQSPLKDFQLGIGIATGAAVAGKIGTSDQVKVTVFGPVVNLASRLESMSRWFGSMVLADGNTARNISASRLVGARRLARVRPFGLAGETDLHQIYLHDAGPDESHRQRYASALHLFETGDWQQAAEILSTINASDAAATFLLDFIRKAGDSAPKDFDGVIRMDAK